MRALASILFGASLLIFCIFYSEDANAQGTYEGCFVGNSQPVASVQNTNINDIATAVIYNGAPVIFYNPYVVSSVSPITARFFYFHECAHHVLGHTVGMGYPLTNEQAADCWAIVNLVRSGQFGQRELNQVQQELWTRGRGDWSHLPGPRRAINLALCLQG